MRWSAIKKIWGLCKIAFPDKKVWPDIPFRFLKQGNINVYDMKSGKEIGKVQYETLPQKILFKVDEFFDDVPLERSPVFSFSVNHSKIADLKPPTKVGKLVSQNYHGEELLEKAELLYSSESHSLPFDSWLSVNEFPAYLLQMAEKKKYDKYQRVRVVNPSSMEHNEMGVILDIRGDRNKGFEYLVLVDGSSKPLWFHQDSLEFNLSGVIVNE